LTAAARRRANRAARVGFDRAGIVSRTQRRDPERAETAAIAAMVDLDGKRVLDVGCGGGRLTAFAAERAAWVYAFDPEPENVARAAAAVAVELRERVRFGVHDAEALDVGRQRFDLALCGWSL
jgi:2-polyprenyl-3-methyl-5-hydroxy-6-metoxy-1,4-benzoquinol methylase